jgi:hypothetical protein
MASGIEVAWALADATSECFTDTDRAAVYSALGAGEFYAAICCALVIAVQKRQALPASLIADLKAWLDGYAGLRCEQCFATS